MAVHVAQRQYMPPSVPFLTLVQLVDLGVCLARCVKQCPTPTAHSDSDIDLSEPRTHMMLLKLAAHLENVWAGQNDLVRQGNTGLVAQLREVGPQHEVLQA